VRHKHYFRIAPAIILFSVLMACLVIPFGPYRGIVSFDGDFIFFRYILALGKFSALFQRWIQESSFEGMGASREALFSMFAEPAFFILIGSFALSLAIHPFQYFFSTCIWLIHNLSLGTLAACVPCTDWL